MNDMRAMEWMRSCIRHGALRWIWCAGGTAAAWGILRLCGTDGWDAAYALLIGWAVCLPLLLWRAGKSYAHWRALSGMCISDAPTEECLPEVGSAVEERYRALAGELLRRSTAERTEYARRYDAAMEYYTLWTHQIKTPIAALRLLLDDSASENTGEMKDELLRITQYVEMALHYLRLESETTDYVFRRCDADAVMRGVIRRHGREFIRRHLKMEYHALEFSPLTDEKWLGFVLDQVLSNALKYTVCGGISVYREGDDTIVVQDTGIGIRPEDLPRVFERGYTGGNGRLGCCSTGIGLYLCKQVCRRLGHEISIESTVGCGTKVRLCLRSREVSPME